MEKKYCTMKKTILFSLLLSYTMVLLMGCKKTNYPGGEIAPFIALFDIRDMYRGSDVTLTKENMFGSENISCIVVSDHAGGNLPQGLLIVQDQRRLGQLRGIAIPIGAEAAKYVSGDSVIIKVAGKTVTKVNGMLQITGVQPGDITKVSSGNAIAPNRIPSNKILEDPEKYECTLVAIVKGGFDPLPGPHDVLAGTRKLNDGFGDLPFIVDATATFANDAVPVLANYYCIVINKPGIGEKPVTELRMRKSDDIVLLSAVVEIAPAIITGFMSDVKGGDGNYEYVQLLATRDIDFAETPFSVVVTNNANASLPTGAPAQGWATGNMRSYKLSLFEGYAVKGTFFYVGGAGKMINGSGSTSMASSNWIRAFNYTASDGDGFGAKTGGLMANSGNAFGIAVFSDSAVDVNSKPVDVIWISNGGALFEAPSKGYRITNTDWYDVKDPLTLEEQPYYRAGNNTLCLTYNTSDQGYFNMLGGEYNSALGRWKKARIQNNVLLTKTSVLTEIEGEGATKLQ